MLWFAQLFCCWNYIELGKFEITADIYELLSFILQKHITFY